MADLSDHLITLAWELAKHKTKGDALHEVSVRRAVSTAYYAVLHALLRAFAEQVVRPEHRLDDAYSTVYRFPDHRPLLNSLLAASGDETLKNIATTFKALHELRMKADYDPRPLDIGDAELDTLMEDAFWTAASIRALDPQQRLAITAALLSKRR